MQSGYICQSAVDESDTSFDIINDKGTITDSNGNVLAEIDMSKIHAAGITQYTSETKIIQPYDAFLLQGPEKGLAYAAYYYRLPKIITDNKDYDKFLNVDFDIVYNNCTPMVFHVSVRADGVTSMIQRINTQLSKNNISVATVISEYNELDCENNPVTNDYIQFMAQETGYFYYIKNLLISPEFRSEDFPDSPFSKDVGGLDDKIIELLNKYHPVQKGEIYVPGSYEPDCKIYTWLRYNCLDAVGQISKFKEALDKLNTITPDMTPEEIQAIWDEALIIISDTCYMEIISFYDVENLNAIYSIVNDLRDWMIATHAYYAPCYWLEEDECKRVPLMKYPNGAFRGVVLIPDWPVNYSEDFEYSTLWISHIPNSVRLLEPTKECGKFTTRYVGVIANATLMTEQECFLPQGKKCKCQCCSNGEINNSCGDGIFDNIQETIVNKYAPSDSIYEDMFMGRFCYPTKQNVIGLYKYMSWVNSNKMWQKVGEGYMVIGKPDDPQSRIKNLLTSMVIYNPNPVPIRIKYLVFA